MPDISTPHISKDWREDFIIAMRTQDASGEQIGDALATVDAHCAESGESAEEAFGDPTTYATTLVPEPAAGSGFGASFLVGVLMGLLGLLIVPRAVDDWVTRTPFTVTIGTVGPIVIDTGCPIPGGAAWDWGILDLDTGALPRLSLYPEAGL